MTLESTPDPTGAPRTEPIGQGPEGTAPGPMAGGGPARRTAAPDTEAWSRSEVTRMLSLSGYLDRGYRSHVIALLVRAGHRAVAPALGFDTAAVLAHCLRARALERDAARRIVLAWALLLTLLALAAWWILAVGAAGLSGREPGAGLALLLAVLGAAAFVLLAPQVPGASALGTVHDAALRIRAVILPTEAVRAYRDRVLKILVHEMAEGCFSGRPPEVASEHRQIFDSIRREQYSAVVPYNVTDPFLGAGMPLKQWSMVLDLRPAHDNGKGAATEETGEGRAPCASERVLPARRIIDAIRPRLEGLTVPSASGGRDRLEGLDVTECVYLPAPLPYGQGRSALNTGPADDVFVALHLAEAVGEGGELRRHFLRVRVGAWEEEVVTTVFVRVHTQGGMLFLEVAPHVLFPLSEGHHHRAALVEAATCGMDVRRALAAYLRMPIRPDTLLGTLLSFREAESEEPPSTQAMPPAASLREQVSAERLSVFQTMDVVRYVKTVHERISAGVHEALHDAGFRTEEFQEQVQQWITVGQGGVFVGGDMSGGAVATGRNAQAHNGEPSARKGAGGSGGPGGAGKG
ncbi:hypothetical protein [Nocardiopsis baichengensis]|uniref:hypothetical protein n=1 Tax=Nocardiopsis baichengensis TaxID=280240 RepID=UPI000380B7A9|nr:hypothetical protein [Nocardiopsis baichengensis]